MFLKQKYSIDQDEELLAEIRKLDQVMNSKLHLAFLFASPLVTPFRTGDQINFMDVSKIDYQKELNVVLAGLRNTNNSIKYRKVCATQHNFINILTEGTIALHFSGHGAKNNEENFPRSLRDEGDFLVFEDEDGKA